MLALLRPVSTAVALGLIATTVLAQNVATVIYYSSTARCSGSSLRCSNIPQLDCCEAPPSPTSFHLSQVSAGFSPCIQLFFNNDGHGGCAGCSSGGACNTCYIIQNNPFTPALWFTTQSCNARRIAVDNMALQGNSTSCHEVNEAVTEDGRVYAVPNKASGRKEEFVEDLLTLSGDNFHAAWGHTFLRAEKQSGPSAATASLAHPVDLSDK